MPRGSRSSLAESHPQVAAQWHPTRNGERTPQDTAPRASYRVWWRCPAGHEWEEVVSQRTSTIPKWKQGDPSACRECVGNVGLVAYTYPDCGHTRRVQRQTAVKGYRVCWDCGAEAREANRKERRRASARAYWHRRKARGRALTDEERTAQRHLVGVVNNAGADVCEDGLMFIRDPQLRMIYEGASGDDIAGWLQVLGVPHVRDDVVSFDTQRGRVTHHERVLVEWEALDSLAEWAPTLVEKARAATGR